MSDSELIGGAPPNTFFQHVFNFDEESKKEMMNIVQYTLVGVIPIVLLNKIMQRFVPEADDEKGSIELLAEVALQLVVMFLGLLIVHRIVTFVPTYSGSKFEKLSVTNIVLVALMITLSLQTKLGEKISILYDRVFHLIMGKREGMENKEDEEDESSDDAQPQMQAPQLPTSMAASPPTGSSDVRDVMKKSSTFAGPRTKNYPQTGNHYGSTHHKPGAKHPNQGGGGTLGMQGGGMPLMAANEAFGAGAFGSLLG